MKKCDNTCDVFSLDFKCQICQISQISNFRFQISDFRFQIKTDEDSDIISAEAFSQLVPQSLAVQSAGGSKCWPAGQKPAVNRGQVTLNSGPSSGKGIAVSWSERLFGFCVMIGVPLLLIVFPLYLLFGGLRTFALRPLKRCFAGIQVRESPELGDVECVYHTYRGLLLWVTQDEHRFFATADDSERLLGRLLRFNLTWGLSYGMLFIPFLAVGNYHAQKRSIRQQVNAPRYLERSAVLQSSRSPGSGVR